MARFLYSHPETDELIEREFPCGEAPQSITLEDGTTCQRNMGAEIRGQRSGTIARWPIYSQAMAVHPEKRQKYEEFARRHGVPTAFDERGRPEFTSQKHQNDYCKLLGAINYDRYY